MNMGDRVGKVERRTNETDVSVELDLDGGSYSNKTGVGFFDHMLDHVAKHGGFGLRVKADGDRHVDDHHTVEDVGIALGEALVAAVGDKRGIERYGFASVPMEDALARVSVDLSGRAALVYSVGVGGFGEGGGKIGTFDTQLVREFLTAFSQNGRLNCHVEVPHGENLHHVAEAVFKGLGRALRVAVGRTGDGGVPSTKGVL